MHVVATAGHVDHGKSTLVQALTGTDPDRLAEEQRRGLTIELGYAWTSWPDLGDGDGGDVAFVDVPGHERFLTTMLAGVGPVPATLLVVAADDPWMPQAAEHLAALDALGVRHGVVAVTRSDLADPGPAAARAAAEVSRTSLAGAPVVTVSGRTGAGLDDLRAALTAMLAAVPTPDVDADVRLWVDRRFTVRGAGTVVTATLPAGTVRVGDTLADGERLVRVRGLQALGRDAQAVSGTARVALNLTGDVAGLGRGTVLTTPGAWHHTEVVDVRLRPGPGEGGPPLEPQLHVGAADVAVRHRPLGAADHGIARLTLERSLPLRVGDRMLLRDPGRRRLWRVDVLDPDPPRLRRRGAADRRATQLAGADGTPRLADELARRGLAHRDRMRRIGVPVAPGDHLEAGPWLVSRGLATTLADRLPPLVEEHARSHPLDPDVPLAVLADRLRLPSADLVAPLVRPPLQVVGGRVRRPGSGLPAEVAASVDVVRRELAVTPFAAPTADRLRELGLDERALGAAERAGLLWRVAPGIVLLPGADHDAAARLARLDQPFTTSAARQDLGTSRRVVLPLLDRLDRAGLTRRLADDRREVVR